MPELDAYQYLGHLRARWRVAAAAAAIAFLLAVAAGLVTSSKYTAAARIVIEPPAGGDGRMSMAVSPIYLEMLRTYEHFAMSDSLFQRALEHFRLRAAEPGRTIESWKRAVLEVEIPRNTKILEIRATLDDPRKAQALAQFLAEETVKMNRAVNREADQEIVRDLEAQLEQARRDLEAAETQWRKAASAEPVETVEAEIQAMKSRRFRIERDLLAAEAGMAEHSARKSPTPAESSLLEAAQSRAQYLRGQLQELDRTLERRGTALADRSARRDQLAARRKSAQSSLDNLRTRLEEARASSGFRGERLRLIDPGIVPERPSSPNIPLNVIAAVLLALIVSWIYLTLEYAWRSGRGQAETRFGVAGRGGDD